GVHREEGGTPRGAEPFVGGDDEVVDVLGPQRQPAGGLRRVENGDGPDRAGAGDDRGDVGDLAGGRLDGREADETRILLDRLGQVRQRRAAHSDVAGGV